METITTNSINSGFYLTKFNNQMELFGYYDTSLNTLQFKYESFIRKLSIFPETI